jgi:hypothetical protein
VRWLGEDVGARLGSKGVMGGRELEVAFRMKGGVEFVVW